MTSLLQAHQEQLERFRNTMNLVGPGPISFHYDDATRALSALTPTGHWADMGTGAGFPGVVFAHLFPHVHVDLIDSRQKRCWFLNHVLQQAERPDDAGRIQVICSRIEHLPSNQYDGIMARALAKPEAVMALTSSYIRPNGFLVLLLQEHQEVTCTSHFVAHSSHRYEIDGKHRKTAVFQRVD